jgi:hypothetical protein
MQNFGRLINLVTGIQGVNPGGQASINMPVNQRIHRENFQCTGIAWINPTVTISPPAGAGAQATATATVVNGVITGFVVTAAGSGYSGLTPTATITDEIYGANLFNASATVNIAGGDTVVSLVLVSGGTVAPVPVERFFTSLKHLVGGAIMRDIGAAEVLAIAGFNNLLPFLATTLRGGQTFGERAAAYVGAVTADLLFPALGQVGGNASQMALPYSLGQLPVYFTEPWRKIVNHDTATSWDLYGQSTYQILAGISPGVNSPGLVGTYEFDYLRNAIPQKNAQGKTVSSTPFLKPVKQHSFSFNVPAGVYDITTLPVTFPISRLYFYGPSLPYQMEVFQDGNKVLEGTAEQINQQYRDYGFNTDMFDMAAVFDVDQRLGNALKVARTLDVRIWNTNPDQLTVVMESIPPAFM